MVIINIKCWVSQVYWANLTPYYHSLFSIHHTAIKKYLLLIGQFLVDVVKLYTKRAIKPGVNTVFDCGFYVMLEPCCSL